MRLLTFSKRFSMSLLGPFRLTGPGGESLVLSSKKGVVMLAMLATSPNGERTRAWLQSRLWGSRGEMQARASMRRELANLRKTLGETTDELLQVDAGRVRLRLEKMDVDVVRIQPEGWAAAAGPDAEFLEGIDIRGEAAFDAWLKLVRGSIAGQRNLRESGDQPPRAGPGVGRATGHAHPAQASVNIWLPPVEQAFAVGDLGLARGRVSEIAGLLARVRWLRVVAGEAGGPAAGFVGDVPFNYVVERVIVGEPAESVELKLLRAETRELLFVERLPLAGEAAERPPIVPMVARFVARIEREEQARSMRVAASEEDFHGSIWRARWHLNRLTRADAKAATQLVDRALALAPQSPEALIQRAILVAWEKWARRAARPEFGAVADLARRAILLDPDDARGYWLAGVAETWLRNSNTAIAWLRRAIEVDPTFEPAYAQLGGTLNLCDRPAEAMEVLDFAMSLSPNDMHLFFRHSEFALTSLLLGQYDAAVEWADRALLLRPGYWYAEIIKIYALVETGRIEAAHDLYGEMSRQHPAFGEDYVAWVPFVDRGWTERIMARLQIAARGLEDTPRLKAV
jgi:tetratricopeptide (TPR) repeat protein